MKVCGKKDIHVPGCDDCSELEERVEAVEECCDDAHEEIDTLNTDKADKDYVDDSIETVNQTIVDVADTLGERIDNIITASEPSVITLWEGVMDSIGDSANLSEDVNDFDYLDIYYRTSVDESEGYYNTVRIPADQFANYTITVGGTLSPLGESPNLSQYLTQLSFVDDTATIDNIREWSWNGSQSSDASDDPQAETGVTIYRIDGVKETGGNAEIADARIGVDGTVYPSLGDAIRGQIQDTRDMIPQLVKTVQGNPIVIDDAFGEVKKLDVELTPIQDLHGYDKPWSGGAGKNKFDKSLLSDYTKYVDYVSSYHYTAPIFLKPNTTYTISPTSTASLGAGLYYVLYTNLDASDPNYLVITNPAVTYPVNSGAPQNKTITTGATGVIRFGIANSTDLATVMGIDYQLEEGSTASSWTPYENICPITGHDSVTVGVTDGDSQSQSKTVTLPHTVYGAGVGFTSGEGKEKYGIVDLGTLNWGYNSNYGVFYSAGIDTLAKSAGKCVCDSYASVTGGDVTTDGGIQIGRVGWFNQDVIVKDTRYTDGATFKQAVSGVMLCYELQNYTDLSTTPTSLTLYNGDNVISSDGNMELSYVQDMAMVIRKIEAQL